MIIVNYYQEEDYNANTDDYHLNLAGIVNDVLKLHDDIDMIKECIENCGEFKPKNGVMYEIYLDRATIASSFPTVEQAFAVNRIVEKVYDKDICEHITPLFRL